MPEAPARRPQQQSFRRDDFASDLHRFAQCRDTADSSIFLVRLRGVRMPVTNMRGGMVDDQRRAAIPAAGGFPITHQEHKA